MAKAFIFSAEYRRGFGFKWGEDWIGGLLFFQDDKTMPKKIIAAVKGGENMSVALVRDLVRGG